MERSASGAGPWAGQSNAPWETSSRGRSTIQGRGHGRSRVGGIVRDRRSWNRDGAGGGRREQVPAPTPPPPKPSEAPTTSRLAERLPAAGERQPERAQVEPKTFDAAVGSERKKDCSVANGVNGGEHPSTSGYYEWVNPQRRFGFASVDVPLEGAVGGVSPQEDRNSFTWWHSLLEREQMWDPNYPDYLDYETTSGGYPWERPGNPWENKPLPEESFNFFRLWETLPTEPNPMLMEDPLGSPRSSPESRQGPQSGPSREMVMGTQTQQSFTFTTVDPTGLFPKPAVFAFPERPINFTKECIQFSCQVFNIPESITISARMFQAVAETPSGRLIPCKIRGLSPTGPQGRFALETVLGSFMSTGEIGVYVLKVRMVLPFKPLEFLAHNFSDFGVNTDTADILICRNYFKQSKIAGYSYQLEFLPYAIRSVMPEQPPSKAWGLACDKITNHIYYTDRSGGRVNCMDPNTGRILFYFDQSRMGICLNKPTGLCCDEFNRRVLVCDKDNHRICVFSMDGQFIASFGSHGYRKGQFAYPWDVDVNNNGSRIVVTDSRNKRLQLFDGLGNYLNKFTVFEKNPFEYKKNFDYPRGVSFDADGQLIYVTDFNTQNVIKLPINFAGYQRVIQNWKMSRPQGIVVDSMGGFLVADSKNNCLFHCDGDGDILSTIKSIGKNTLQYPVNVALLQDGYVAVVDGNGKISIF